MNGEVPGSHDAAELTALPGFSMTTLVCPASGGIEDKNWRRAGEFADIALALTERARAARPPVPASAILASAASSAASDVDALIDTTSTKLFGHVADLMKELENRREEKSLNESLQRQVAILREELAHARERADLLETRLSRLPELEESQRADRAKIEALRADLAAREQALETARAAAENRKDEAAQTQSRYNGAALDLAERDRRIDLLSKELREKEQSLAKSLDVIRRLEQGLNQLPPVAARRAPAPEENEPLAEPLATPLAPERGDAAPILPSEPSYTLDEATPLAPYLEEMPPHVKPNAWQKLVSGIERLFPGLPR